MREAVSALRQPVPPQLTKEPQSPPEETYCDPSDSALLPAGALQHTLQHTETPLYASPHAATAAAQRVSHETYHNATHCSAATHAATPTLQHESNETYPHQHTATHTTTHTATRTTYPHQHTSREQAYAHQMRPATESSTSAKEAYIPAKETSPHQHTPREQAEQPNTNIHHTATHTATEHGRGAEVLYAASPRAHVHSASVSPGASPAGLFRVCGYAFLLDMYRSLLDIYWSLSCMWICVAFGYICVSFGCI